MSREPEFDCLINTFGVGIRNDRPEDEEEPEELEDGDGE